MPLTHERAVRTSQMEPNPCYGIPAEEIARICRVSLKTAMRWKHGDTHPPQTALMILTGDLGYLDPAWRGWMLQDGKLVSREGWEVTAGDVLSLPLLRAQIATYQAKERQILAMDEQPEPGALPAIRA